MPVDDRRLRVALDELAGTVERFLEEAERLVLNHPHFGSLSIERFLRLAAVHVDHHRRQVAVLARAAA